MSSTTCAVVGAGPAGLVLGLLLARAGVRVTVLEAHADFLRDFRGDTVHPSTLDLLDDLGLFEAFDALPHSRVERVTLPDPAGGAGGGAVVADFSRLRRRHPYVAMVPQWDLLDLLARAARAEPTFTLLTEHRVTGVVREDDDGARSAGGRVCGVEHTSPDGPGRLLADLVVACDGRWSAVRRAVGLPVREFPVGFDVWWYRITTGRRVGESLLPRVGRGRMTIAIPREGYLQVARLGMKGSDAAVRAQGLEAFREEAAQVLPEVAGDVGSIASLDDVKVLDVRLDRLRRWWAPGVLCVGDAAHAMSPVGGVGINLAVQDAVAAARLLAGPLRTGVFRDGDGSQHLARVQRRRALPTVVVQTVQRVLHARLVMPALRGETAGPPPALLRLVRRFPQLTVLPAFVVGVGVLPERAPGWARRPSAPLRQEAAAAVPAEELEPVVAAALHELGVLDPRERPWLAAHWVAQGRGGEVLAELAGLRGDEPEVSDLWPAALAEVGVPSPVPRARRVALPWLLARVEAGEHDVAWFVRVVWPTRAEQHDDDDELDEVVYAIDTALDHVGALEEPVEGRRAPRRDAEVVRRLRAQVGTALAALAAGDVTAAAAAFEG